MLNHAGRVSEIERSSGRQVGCIQTVDLARSSSSTSLLRLALHRMISSIKNNADKVQLDLSKLPSFEKILIALEGQLLDGRIFQVSVRRPASFSRIDERVSSKNCIEQIFDKEVTVTKNLLLQEEFIAMIRQLLSSVEPKLGKNAACSSLANGVSFRRRIYRVRRTSEICRHLCSVLLSLSAVPYRR